MNRSALEFPFRPQSADLSRSPQLKPTKGDEVLLAQLLSLDGKFESPHEDELSDEEKKEEAEEVPAPGEPDSLLCATATATAVETGKKLPRVCQCCFEEEQEGGVIICTACENFTCAPCWKQYIQSKGDFKMTCPIITCPSTSCRSYIPSTVWGQLFDQQQNEAFLQSCRNLLTMQCAGCHTRRTLFVQDSTASAKSDEGCTSALFRRILGYVFHHLGLFFKHGTRLRI